MHYKKNLLIVVLVIGFVVGVAWMREGVDRNSTQSNPSGELMQPKLIEFGSDTCVPCIMMEEVLAELREKYSDHLDIVFIHAKNTEEVKKYNIKAIPTQLFFDATGKEFYRHVGFWSVEEILQEFAKNGISVEEKTP